MTPAHRSRAAMKALRNGILKMEDTMSLAAQVRRQFRLGRPPKPGEQLPLHRTVVWNRATEAVGSFRERMTAAGLDPNHVEAGIVFISSADQDQPQFLPMEGEGKSAEDWKQAAFEQLGRDDVIALGMVFRQFDAKAGKSTTFPYQFMGLNDRGIAVMRKAVEMLEGCKEFRILN